MELVVVVVVLVPGKLVDVDVEDEVVVGGAVVVVEDEPLELVVVLDVELLEVDVEDAVDDVLVVVLVAVGE